MQGHVIRALSAYQAIVLKASQQRGISLANNHVHVCFQHSITQHQAFPLLSCPFVSKFVRCCATSQVLALKDLAIQPHSSNMVAIIDGERKPLFLFIVYVPTWPILREQKKVLRWVTLHEEEDTCRAACRRSDQGSRRASSRAEPGGGSQVPWSRSMRVTSSMGSCLRLGSILACSPIRNGIGAVK